MCRLSLCLWLWIYSDLPILVPNATGSDNKLTQLLINRPVVGPSWIFQEFVDLDYLVK